MKIIQSADKYFLHRDKRVYFDLHLSSGKSIFQSAYSVKDRPYREKCAKPEGAVYGKITKQTPR